MRRGVGWLGWVLIAWGLVMLPVEAEMAGVTPEQYAAVQAAFLREDFDSVIRLTERILRDSSHTQRFTDGGPGDMSRMVRVRLWYVLSLERLQRANDALRELDRLKDDLLHLPTASAGQIGLEQLWPEVIFWEGEVSRKAFQMIRARLAYQRVLAGFADSSWRSQAQLGLGLVFFHQQAYDAARQQVRELLETESVSLPLARQAVLLDGLCGLKLKHFDEALGRFRQLLEQPLDETMRIQVTFYLGEALTALSRFEEAAAAYQRVIDDGPNSSWAHVARFGLGWSAFQQHRCNESLEAFRDYLAAMPAASRDGSGDETVHLDAEVLFAQGRCLMEMGDEAQALTSFQRLRKDSPRHALVVDAMLSVAELLERQQRFDDAMAALDEILSQPLTAAQKHQAHLRIGSLRLAEGDATKAIEQFLLAKESPDVSLRQAALNGLGDAEVLAGNYDVAVQRYEQAVQMAPTSRPALYAAYQLGRVKLQTGQTEAAIQMFQSLSAQPDRAVAADARLALAFAYLSRERPEDARRELQRLQTEEAGSSQAHRANYYRALLAVREENPDAAKRLCNEVIHRVPQSDEALEARLLLIDLTTVQDSPTDALAILSQSVGELHGVPRRHRGRVMKRLGDFARQIGAYAQAIVWYEAAWEGLPGQRGELDYRLASCYEEAGDVVVATHRYQAITQAPWRVRGQLAAAKLMEREGRWQEAAELYEAITRQAVPEAKIARERLASLGPLVPRDPVRTP